MTEHRRLAPASRGAMLMTGSRHRYVRRRVLVASPIRSGRPARPPRPMQGAATGPTRGGYRPELSHDSPLRSQGRSPLASSHSWWRPILRVGRPLEGWCGQCAPPGPTVALLEHKAAAVGPGSIRRLRADPAEPGCRSRRRSSPRRDGAHSCESQITENRSPAVRYEVRTATSPPGR